MYITTPRNHLVALDARTGTQVWRYEHPLNTTHLCCGSANRGAGLGYGKIYMATADARLLAVDQKTGKLVWEVALASSAEGKTETTDMLSASDPLRHAAVTGASGVGANMAPLVYKGKVIVGVTGAGFGLHLDNTRGKQPIGTVICRGGAYAHPLHRAYKSWRRRPSAAPLHHYNSHRCGRHPTLAHIRVVEGRGGVGRAVR